jgi:hypothetical protein
VRAAAPSRSSPAKRGRGTIRRSEAKADGGPPSRSSRQASRLRPLGFGAAAFAASRAKAGGGGRPAPLIISQHRVRPRPLHRLAVPLPRFTGEDQPSARARAPITARRVTAPATPGSNLRASAPPCAPHRLPPQNVPYLFLTPAAAALHSPDEFRRRHNPCDRGRLGAAAAPRPCAAGAGARARSGPMHRNSRNFDEQLYCRRAAGHRRPAAAHRKRGNFDEQLSCRSPAAPPRRPQGQPQRRHPRPALGPPPYAPSLHPRPSRAIGRLLPRTAGRHCARPRHPQGRHPGAAS